MNRGEAMSLRRLLYWLAGSPLELPDALRERYPELDGAKWRRGGLALRVGGWCLGRRTVSGITLWRTVWIAQSIALDPELLLHELRHVHQFQADSFFPLRYAWGSVRNGYVNNPYEADARAYAARRSTSAYPTA
ncbi:MAG: hypothetical protein ABJE47_24765 [bacterium]